MSSKRKSRLGWIIVAAIAVAALLAIFGRPTTDPHDYSTRPEQEKFGR